MSLFLSAISRRSGMMECWSIGILDIKSGMNRLIVFLPLKPSFQYSIIPTFQLGQTPEFLYDQQVIKILPEKVRKLQTWSVTGIHC